MTEIFHNRLKHARKKARMSQVALANKTGLSRSLICAYEKHSQARYDNLAKLAKALNTSTDYLIGLTPCKKAAYSFQKPKEELQNLQRLVTKEIDQDKIRETLDELVVQLKSIIYRNATFFWQDLYYEDSFNCYELAYYAIGDKIARHIGSELTDYAVKLDRDVEIAEKNIEPINNEEGN